jgi:hypothetical protein
MRSVVGKKDQSKGDRGLISRRADVRSLSAQVCFSANHGLDFDR